MSRCSPDEESASSSAYREEAQTWDVGDLIDAHLPELRPFRTFYTSDSEPRVNLVVDSEVIGGGDSPAFIFSALLANRMRASLRILTREAPGDPAAFGRLLALNDVRLFGTLELEQLSYGDDVNDSPDFEIGDQDLFVTTSWKTTRAATQSAPVGRVIYLVSDDERMHLSAGDARIMCSEVLSDDRIKTVVISRGLHRHLIETGLERLTHDGLCFDPAFPQHTFQSRPRSGMNRFLFCVRRHHPEDLIIRGLEAVNTAVETGVLPRSWALTFVGVRDHLRVAGGAQSRVHADIGLDGFVDELRRTDLTLSLRLSPVCPFPALAAVATGGVAVTNARPCRLAPPIGNLLSADVATASLVGALERGARLALDSATRASNYNQQEFPRSWTMAVGPVLDRIVPA